MAKPGGRRRAAENRASGGPQGCGVRVVSLALGQDVLSVGARLRAGTALLEVTKKPHNGCKKFLARFGEGAMAWVNDDSGRARRLRGVNCRVVEPGSVCVGDAVDRVL